MRRALHCCLLAALAPLGACSLVLEDPLPFRAVGGDADLDAAVDAATDGPSLRLDLAPLDLAPGAIDFAPPTDRALPPADRGPAPADRGPPDAELECVPADEICDGRDNDCDGAIDETFAGACAPCGVAGGRGLCARGARLCVQGAVQCVPWLPDPAEVVDCDLYDNDCDGTIDEFGERNAPRSVTGEQLVALCGQPDSVVPVPGEGCGVTPRVVGCEAAHACARPACLSGCAADLQILQRTCDEPCAGPEGDEAVEACQERLTSCHAGARQAFEGCVAACPSGDAERWSCQNGRGGPVCTAVGCPPGQRADGPDCVLD